MVVVRSGGRFVVAAASLGGALGFAAYRIAALPFNTDHPWRHIGFLAIAIVLAVGALRIARSDEPWQWRPRWAVGSAAIATASLAAAISWLISPPWHFETHRKELPGFSVALPAGTEKGVKLEYPGGFFRLAEIGDDDANVDVEWLGGTMPSEERELALGRVLAKALAVNVDAVRFVGDRHDVMEIGDRYFMSIVHCGARVLQIKTESLHLDQHESITHSVDCHPDTTREEKTLDRLPIAFDMTGLQVAMRGVSRATLHGDDIQISLAVSPSTHSKESIGRSMKRMLPGSLAAMGVTATSIDYEEDSASFATDDGRHGWVRFVSCPTSMVMVSGLSNDEATQRLWLARAKAARCLSDDEQPTRL